MNTLTKTMMLTATLAATGALPAHAADVFLVAGAYDLTLQLPDGGVDTLPMWGYAAVAPDTFAGLACGEATQSLEYASGPHLATEDGTLTLHLLNCLDVATSVSVPGLLPPTVTINGVQTRNKTWMLPGGGSVQAEGRPQPDARLRSLVAETPPGEAATYAWSAIRPGSFLYQSGSHLAVQVQMGLYGSLVATAAGGAPRPGLEVAQDVVLLYSEIDPDMHRDVAEGRYGNERTSTLRYHPAYFLINGTIYDPATAVPLSVPLAEATFLRFLNAGLETRVPTLVSGGEDMDILAEDGRDYAHPRRQYSVALPPGKTSDALFVPEREGVYALIDRTNAAVPGSSSGGNTVVLSSGAAGGAVTAVADTYAPVEDTAFAVAAAEGVLVNDTVSVTDTSVDPPVTSDEPLPSDASALLVSEVVHGTLLLSTDGGFSYAPDADFSGLDSFSYRVRLADGTLSAPAEVTLNVAPVNDPPVGVADAYQVVAGQTITVGAAAGVIANDLDVDGDALSVASATGFSPAADGSFSYTAPDVAEVTVLSFSYMLSDGAVSVGPVGVSMTVQPAVNQPPVAMDDHVQTPQNTPIVISVLSNDTDSDNGLDPTSVTIVEPPSRKGTASVNTTGTITYTPGRNFRGSEFFTYTVRDTLGATSNPATVQVDVVRTASGTGG